VNLFDARTRLERIALDAGIVNAERKARYIFEHFTGLTVEDLYRYGDEIILRPWKYAQMVRAMNRLVTGTPVQLILGYTHFYNDIFLCRKGVLIPRPETETLVDVAVAEIDSRYNPLRILDIFTGSGIVAISIAKARTGHAIHGADISRRAINLAKANASRIGVDVDWRAGDMFAPFSKRAEPFDIITANPPYIPSGDIGRLPLDVRRGDPREALEGGRDGLRFHRRLAREADGYLNAGGCLVVEMGYDQRKAIVQLYKPRKVRFTRDLWRKDRVYLVRY
jgi:release factor glutamine methyltransferase